MTTFRTLAAVRPPLALAAIALAAACADEPTAPVSMDVAPSADIVLGPGVPCTGCVSPDKGKIVYTRVFTDARGTSQYDLVKMDPSGLNHVRLTTTPFHEGGPAWSPDYFRLAYISNEHGNGDIYVMNSDGTNPQRVTDTPDIDEGGVSWLPDGLGLVYTREQVNPDGSHGASKLATIKIDGSGFKSFENLGEPCTTRNKCTPLGHEADVLQPHVSPNGQEVLYLTWNPNTGRMGVRAMKLADPTQRRWIFAGTTWKDSPHAWTARYSPDGAQVAVIMDNVWNDAVRVVDAATCNLVQEFPFTKTDLGGLSFSPDGTQLLVRSGATKGLVRITRATKQVTNIPGTSGAWSPSWSR